MIDKIALKNGAAILTLLILGWGCDPSFAGVQLAIVPAGPSASSEVFLKLTGSEFDVIFKSDRSYLVDVEENFISVVASIGIDNSGNSESPFNTHLLSLGVFEPGEYTVAVRFSQLSLNRPPPQTLGFTVVSGAAGVPGLGFWGIVTLVIGLVLGGIDKRRNLDRQIGR